MLKSLSTALLSVTLLSACQLQAQSPSDVAKLYWTAMAGGDTEAAQKYVSSNSQTAFQKYINQPEDTKLPLHNVHIGDQRTTVTTIIDPADPQDTDYRSFDTVLVLEQGKWKVDAGATRVPAPKTVTEKQMDELADQLTETLDENLETMDEALQEGMQMLNDMLREGSHDMGQSMLKGMEEMNRKLQESIEEMKRHRQQREKPIDEQQGEGMI